MNLISTTISLLNDGKIYLSSISQEAFELPLELLSNASIGQHTRHFIEFFQCLLEQSQQDQVNYDLRKRDARIEESPEFALQKIDNIIIQLTTLLLDKPLTLKNSVDGGISIRTNTTRELLYNLEHCIHHLAIIKIGLKIIAPEIELPPNFGVAPSTIEYRNQLISS